MAMEIDLLKEGGLTEKERAYLEVRDLWHDIALADGLPDGEHARLAYMNSDRNRAAAAEGQRVQGAEVYPPVPAELSDTTGNVGGDGDGDETPYEDLTVVKLKAELEDRHRAAVEAGEVSEVEASTRFAVTGNKQELIDRLYEDDRLVALADAGE